MSKLFLQRRRFIKSSVFGFIGIGIGGYAFGKDNSTKSKAMNNSPYFYRYPSLNDEMVSSIVTVSHFSLDKVKELVSRRPELAGAAWDWGFGDWETALGAASHMGRRDIAGFLMSNGARPDIFTYAMMGMLKSVQEIIESVPGIQSHPGPHGITLLQHARNRLLDKSISSADAANVNKVISYLDSLGNADIKPTSLEITDEEKKKYLGEYRFGDGENEIFLVDLHARGFLQVGRKGASPRMINKTAAQTFSPAGAPSVSIIFKMMDEKAVSFSVHEPEPIVVASRV
jgi:hypothetical protein